VQVTSYRRVVPTPAAAPAPPAESGEDVDFMDTNETGPAAAPAPPADSGEDVDLGIVSTAIVDTNGTGVEARNVKKTTLNALFTLKIGVGSTPVNEYDECGDLLAGSFPVLFPYGVGAPGMLSSRSKSSGPLPSVSLHDHAQYLMSHRDGRFAGHRNAVARST
jgi:hypothetical protein